MLHLVLDLTVRRCVMTSLSLFKQIPFNAGVTDVSKTDLSKQEDYLAKATQ